MIRAQNVFVGFDGKQVLHNVSIHVPVGKIAGYVGPNGAGKTTTMRLLTGTLRPDAGRISIAGIDILGNPVEAKRTFGFVPEHGHLYESFSPQEYLTFIARLYEIDETLAQQRIALLLDYWELTDDGKRSMTGFSKGMKQKVLLSAALLHRPRVLLLDEPLSGLDAEAVLLFRALLRKWAEAGNAVLYSSHILDSVEKIVDHVFVIREGRIIGEGSPEELKSQTAAASLESAFNQLTSTADVMARTEELLHTAFFSDQVPQ